MLHSIPATKAAEAAWLADLVSRSGITASPLSAPRAPVSHDAELIDTLRSLAANRYTQRYAGSILDIEPDRMNALVKKHGITFRPATSRRER